MKQIFLAGFLLVSVPFMAGAQVNVPATTNVATEVALKDAGIVPGNFFYFLDRFTESVNYFATFRAESKAKLALEYAQERASEVHIVLKTKRVQSKEVKSVKDDFEKGLRLAASIVAKQKVKGVDVSSLAKDISDEFEISKDMLKLAYKARYDDLKTQEKDLRKKLVEAIKAGDVVARDVIEAELKKVNEEASMLKDEEDSVDDDFDEEENKFEDSMGKQQSAESHIVNAERARVKFVNDMAVLGSATTTTTVNTLASFDAMLASAKAAFAIGDFEVAKDNAKEARDILRKFFKDERETMDISDSDEDFFDDKMGGMRGKMETSESESEFDGELGDTETSEEARGFFDSRSDIDVRVRTGR